MYAKVGLKGLTRGVFSIGKMNDRIMRLGLTTSPNKVSRKYLQIYMCWFSAKLNCSYCMEINYLSELINARHINSE